MKRTTFILSRTILVGVMTVLALGCSKSADRGPIANPEAAKKISEVLNKGGGGGGEQAAAPVGTGWATIKGRFVYDGNDPPKMAPYDVTKEHSICAPGGKAPSQQTL